MPSFKDNQDREWTVRFDGLLLSDLRAEHKIDLADVTGETYVKLERDDALLTVALCFLCGEQIREANRSAKAFAGRLSGKSLADAMTAIWGAAKVFFRPKVLSALESAYAQRMEAQEKWDALRPMMSMLNQPDCPEAMKQAVMETLATQMQGMRSTDSQRFTESPSASSPLATPATSASPSPDSAVSTPAA